MQLNLGAEILKEYYAFNFIYFGSVNYVQHLSFSPQVNYHPAGSISIEAFIWAKSGYRPHTMHKLHTMDKPVKKSYHARGMT